MWFAGREDAVGSDLRINSEPYTVVGVLPAGFGFLEPRREAVAATRVLGR